ncbi:MAG: D-amino acid dehydrogenase small subunit [Hyphomicrobiales bacterium]|nr:MAG: D-amino acid dehydrogenase small subunit [Hyphomicrobiales bacterium]
MTAPRTIVIGAGIVGVMTAQALAARGEKVLVIDRAARPAELCSHANAGILAVGHASAWAGPGAVASILRALVGREPGVRITRLFDPRLIAWGLMFLRNCPAGAHRRNTAKLQRLSTYSRKLLPDIAAQLNLSGQVRLDGGLYLFHDQAQFRSHAASLGGHGDTDIEVLDREALLARDPALASVSETLAGGFLSPADAVGDCRQFACDVAARLATGPDVEFRFEAEVTGFTRDGRRVSGVRIGDETVPVGQLILATGAETAALTRPLGFRPLIYPVKGYSGTWPILKPEAMPKYPFVDETALMAVAHYGGRLRVTALAEFAGFDRSLPAQRTNMLQDYVQRAFAGAVDLEKAEFWTGLRPSTASGAPFLGRVRGFDNLWINAGHGSLGWTTSAGSAALIAQMATGQTPELTSVSSRARWLIPI